MPCCCRARRAPAALATLAAQGFVDLGPVRVERHGRAAHLLSSNPRYLNAEDQGTIDAMEIGVDVATLDPGTDIAVLRGQPVEHAKYAGRRIFGAGINLTHLYHGTDSVSLVSAAGTWLRAQIPARCRPPGCCARRRERGGLEKPWIAAVEGFAIGGHCQILLTMDYVLAAARCLHDVACPQGGHHSWRREPAAAPVHRRPPGAAADPGRTAAAVRQRGRPPDLRRDRAARTWTRRSSARWRC